MDKAERTAMDEGAVEAARATVLATIEAKAAQIKAERESWGFGSQDWRPLYHSEIVDAVLPLILAYEAAKPAPMSTSGEMVDEIEREMMAWRGANGGVYTIRACAFAVAQKVASRLESLEALFAEQAGD